MDGDGDVVGRHGGREPGRTHHVQVTDLLRRGPLDQHLAHTLERLDGGNATHLPGDGQSPAADPRADIKHRHLWDEPTEDVIQKRVRGAPSLPIQLPRHAAPALDHLRRALLARLEVARRQLPPEFRPVQWNRHTNTPASSGLVKAEMVWGAGVEKNKGSEPSRLPSPRLIAYR